MVEKAFISHQLFIPQLYQSTMDFARSDWEIKASGL